MREPVAAETAAGRLDLLALIDALVHADGASAGFVGRLAIGVVDGATAWWWNAEFDPAPRTHLAAAPAEGASAYLRMSSDVAAEVLRTGGLPARPGYIEHGGDTALLHAFVHRYLERRSLLELRRDLAAPSRVRGR